LTPHSLIDSGKYKVCADHCFACKVGLAKRGAHIGRSRCDYCPLDQAAMPACTNVYDGAYTRWKQAATAELSKQYAAVIRDAWVR
jgi:hypothetical protein